MSGLRERRRAAPRRRRRATTACWSPAASLDVAHRLDGLRLADTEEIVPLPVAHDAAEPAEAEPAAGRADRDRCSTIESPRGCRCPSRAWPDARPAGWKPASDLRPAAARARRRARLDRGALVGLAHDAGRADPEAVTVAIESLCYRGRAALERAAAVRQRARRRARPAAPISTTIRPLLQELLDLVPLALDES